MTSGPQEHDPQPCLLVVVSRQVTALVSFSGSLSLQNGDGSDLRPFHEISEASFWNDGSVERQDAV